MSNLIARDSKVLGATVGAASLVGKEGYAFKFHTDGTVILCAANTDQPEGVILEGAAIGEQCTVALLGFHGTVKAKIGSSPGTVARGTRLEIKADSTWKADAGTSGTVAAVALEAGEADELIEVALLGQAGTTSVDQLITTVTAASVDAVATISGAVEQAGTFIVAVFFGEAALNGTPYDFGDLAITIGSGCVIVRESVADAMAWVQTKSDGTWSLDLTLAASDTVHANAFVVGKVATASVAVTVP